MPIPAPILAAAAVDRRLWPDDLATHLNLLVANGRCGGCFDAWGLQHASDTGICRRTSRTQLMHAEFHHHGRHGIDTLVPLGQLRFATPMGDPLSWSQFHDLATGCLTTRWQGAAGSYELRVAADPDRRDLLVLAWSWDMAAAPPAIVLAAVAGHETDYSGVLVPQAEATAEGRAGVFDVALGTARARIAVSISGAVDLRSDGRRLRLVPTAARGAGRIHLAMGPQSRAADLVRLAAVAAAEADPFAGIAAGWRRRLGDAWIETGDATVQRMWVRWLAQVLATYAPDERCPMPPMGCSGNAWGYHFPQDLSYIHPALLRLGHLDIVQAHVAFYRSRLSAQEAVTRRIYGKDGVMWAWEFPIADGLDLLADGPPPNPFQYEIHNAAYPARMAYEAALHSEAAWAREQAWPVVEASARFYADSVAKGADGRWGIQVTPSMGQDEYGGADAPDYLCALFAAEYTFRAALDLAQRLDLAPAQAARWRQVLADGLGYDRLLEPSGIRRSNARVIFRERAQKHPVQLNPLTFLPLGRIDEATSAAWRQRRTICSVDRPTMAHGGMRGSFYDGWTLPAFALAAVRMRDGEALAREWSELPISQNIDREGITVSESCGFWQPYYTTSMGLLLQAVNDALANDWLGPIEVGTAWPRTWGAGAFHGFRFPGGVERHGSV